MPNTTFFIENGERCGGIIHAPLGSMGGSRIHCHRRAFRIVCVIFGSFVVNRKTSSPLLAMPPRARGAMRIFPIPTTTTEQHRQRGFMQLPVYVPVTRFCNSLR